MLTRIKTSAVRNEALCLPELNSAILSNHTTNFFGVINEICLPTWLHLSAAGAGSRSISHSVDTFFFLSIGSSNSTITSLDRVDKSTDQEWDRRSQSQLGNDVSGADDQNKRRAKRKPTRTHNALALNGI